MQHTLLIAVCVAAAAGAAFTGAAAQEDDETYSQGGILDDEDAYEEADYDWWDGWEAEDDLFDVNDQWVDSDFFSPWDEEQVEAGEDRPEARYEVDERPFGEHETRYEQWREGWWPGDQWEDSWGFDEWEEEDTYEGSDGFGFYDEVYNWELTDEDTQLFDGWYEETGIY